MHSKYIRSEILRKTPVQNETTVSIRLNIPKKGAIYRGQITNSLFLVDYVGTIND